ncbi:hypothetical protein EDD86DRAFT_77856 [Gorgonomyces haynaldii]|nr:hypothetical protein EDD86DRAFT_77856 [Gorgonomyces haynaldii]
MTFVRFTEKSASDSFRRNSFRMERQTSRPSLTGRNPSREPRRPSAHNSPSQSPSPPKEERSTVQNPIHLFARSNSSASIQTELMHHIAPEKKDEEFNQKIILQTAPRRSSVVGDEKMVAQLVYNTSYGGKMEFDLTREETTLGRREDNNIVLTDGKISKYHAVVVKNEEGYYIKDRNSSNGVRLNDRLIEPNQLELLRDGDVIMIGAIALVFNDPASVRRMRANKHMTLEEKYLKLVTILPSEKKYEDTVTIRAELEAEQDVDFSKIDHVEDLPTLREDYEKLRMAYELSKMSVTGDVNKLLAKSLDLMFDILPVDRGVVLLVDPVTGFLSTHYVKLGESQAKEVKEILLSSTIIQKVFYSRKCLITSDAYEDPMLGKAASVRYGQIRSVICVPLIAHNKVYGILHLDSKDRINSFSNKDLSLVKAISNQTAMVIENMNLIKEVENKARITEQLSRFLPPHVVDRMTKQSSELIRTSVREQVGTIIFADIRGFTQFSEKNNPMEVVNLLNDYFERVLSFIVVGQDCIQVQWCCGQVYWRCFDGHVWYHRRRARFRTPCGVCCTRVPDCDQEHERRAIETQQGTNLDWCRYQYWFDG